MVQADGSAIRLIEQQECAAVGVREVVGEAANEAALNLEVLICKARSYRSDGKDEG